MSGDRLNARWAVTGMGRFAVGQSNEVTHDLRPVPSRRAERHRAGGAMLHPDSYFPSKKRSCESGSLGRSYRSVIFPSPSKARTWTSSTSRVAPSGRLAVSRTITTAW